MTRAVAFLLTLALVVGAGSVAALEVFGREDGSASVAPTPDPGSTDAPSPDLTRFYHQQLTWEDCRDGDLCASLKVPLDYRKPEGYSIDLALLKVPASGDRVGSLVVNPGGPGARGTDYAAAADSVFRQPVRDAFDIVGFDPRGTGASAPVDCLSDDDLDAYVAEDPEPDTTAEIDEYEGWVKALGAGCARRSGALAAHISTVEAARDMDILRAALGESTLDYFGASYGTKLGATYADLFPEKVGRFVLDGALDPALSSRELSLGQAQGFETALRSYVQDCVDQGDCVLGDSLDAGLARVSDFLDQVAESPLDTDTDRQLRIGNAFYGVVWPLYSEQAWPYLTQALQEAFDGDGSMLLRFSDGYSSRGPSGYTDNSLEANYAINCLDNPWSIPPAEVPDNLADFEKASPTFGDVFAWGLTSCGGVKVRASEKPPRIDAPGAAPIVVIGTTRDPATPYAWAVSLADELDSGVLISRDGDGHTGYNSDNACVDDAVESYLIDGTVPEDGLSC